MSQVNLNNAQKILNKLHSEINNYSSYEVGCVKNLSLANFRDPEYSVTFEMAIKEDKKTKTQPLEDFLAYCQDYITLKEKVFMENQNCQVSKILAEIHILEKQKPVFQRLLEKVKNNNYGTEFVKANNVVEKIKELTKESEIVSQATSFDGKYPIKSLNFLHYSEKELKEKIKKIEQDKFRLEQEKDNLNGTTVFKVELSKATRELVGL